MAADEQTMLLMPDPLRVTPDDPQLKRLIQAERVRMLFGAALPVEVVNCLFAIALAALIGAQVGWQKAMVWAGACLVTTAIRLMIYRAYIRSPQRDHPRWLHSMTLMAALLGGCWGLGGAWLLPINDLNVSAVIVGSLIGSSAISTFALQAHPRPSRVFNALLLVPCAVMLLTRQDAYGLFGACGLLALLAIMVLEGERSARRITELLWLRFTTDRIAQERAEALKLAQRHSAVKDQFLATMSHEMRTPLHGILGLARLVSHKLPARPGVLNESREHLALIERSGEHLLGIISDVLDFSRIEAGKLQIEQAPFDLHAVIDDVLSLLAVTAVEKGLPLVRDIQLPSPCMVVGDAVRLRQVLHNLVGNAIKFTDLGHVKVHVKRNDCDEGPNSPCAKRIIFQIEDTGIGIAPDQQSMVFDAFHQADGSFVRRHKGTGLGLTISREIARAMNGDILCESKPGQGSVFTLNLPLPKVTNSEPTRFLATRPSSLFTELDEPGFTGHVLLAEDNPVNALVAQAMLSKLGLQVTHVEDGQQALDLLLSPSHGFDLVLMDCQMPVLDGIEATRRLRCLELEQGRPSVPVIALTANVMSQDRDRCRSVGMDDHLAKPFTPEDLSGMLKTHLHTERQPSFTV